MDKIEKVSFKELGSIIYCLREGKFYAHISDTEVNDNGIFFLGASHTTGGCFQIEFKTEKGVIAWLSGEIDSDGEEEYLKMIENQDQCAKCTCQGIGWNMCRKYENISNDEIIKILVKALEEIKWVLDQVHNTSYNKSRELLNIVGSDREDMYFFGGGAVEEIRVICGEVFKTEYTGIVHGVVQIGFGIWKNDYEDLLSPFFECVTVEEIQHELLRLLLLERKQNEV